MPFSKLDNDELLHLALEAMNTGRDADSVAMLKTLLERQPGNGYALYLLAAQHAQMGLMDRAEEGFRMVVAAAPELHTARFQLGQLLAVKGAANEAREVLRPLTAQQDSLGAYARGISAAAGEDVAAAIEALQQGLAMPQEIPALAGDMQGLLGRLQSLQVADASAFPAHGAPSQRVLGAYQTRE